MNKTRHYYRPHIIIITIIITALSIPALSKAAIIYQEPLGELFVYNSPEKIQAALMAICPPYTSECGFDPALHPAPKKPIR